MGKGVNIFGWILTVLAVIGSIAWGVYGITNWMGKPFFLVDFLAHWQWLANVIYIIVGLVGIALIPTVLAMIFSKRRR